MEDIFSSNRSPFYEFAVKMNLSVISRAELFSFIYEKFAFAGLTISDNVIDDILNMSDCQPHYTQYFSSVVFDLIKAGYDQHAEDFHSTWINRVMRSQIDIFQDIFDQLTNTQRSVLVALSKIKGIGIFSEDARELYKLPTSSSLNEVLKALQKKSLIFKDDQEYKFTNPVYKEWLLSLK